MLDDKQEKEAIEDNPLLDDKDASGPDNEQVMDKPRTGRGKKLLSVVLIILLVLGAAGGVYYWQQQQAKKQQAQLQSQIDDLKKQVAEAERNAAEAKVSPAPAAPTTKTISKSTFSITLPKSWNEVNNSYVSNPEVDYTFADTVTGDYYQVVIDPGGSDYNADTTWEYTVATSGNSIKITGKEADCTKNPDSDLIGMCAQGDGKLSLVISDARSKQGNNTSIKGHNYFFYAGNIKNEKASRSTYQTIAEGIIFK